MSRPYLKRRKRIAKRLRARSKAQQIKREQNMAQALSGFEAARLGREEALKRSAIAGLLAGGA